MADDDFDPIKLKWSEPLDKDFAKLVLKAEQSPSAANGSIGIEGRVEFGVRYQKSPKGYTYTIALKASVLKIDLENCQYAPNLELEEQIQEGMLREHVSISKAEAHKVGGSLDGEASASITKADTKGALKGGIEYQNERKKNTEGERKYAIYRVKYGAPGWQIGDRIYGDYYNPDGILERYFLNGNLGRLEPLRGSKHYAASFKLMAQKGMLRVKLDSKPALANPLHNNEDDAFNALKEAVAGWAVESGLSSRTCPDGYDRGRDEIILAHGQVEVSLTEFIKVEIPNETSKVPLALRPPALNLFEPAKKKPPGFLDIWFRQKKDG